jgi:hypothetical protein
MTNEERAEHLWRGLNTCAGLDRALTITTVTHWLEHHGAGSPDVPLMQERVRDDAKLWAMSASQAELEAYVAAAVMELEKAPITGKAMKRLAALAWKGMNAEARTGFRNWIGEA